MKARLNYVEFAVADLGAATAFYESAFGWSMTAYGPSYAATTTGDTDIGLDADSKATKPLPVIEVDDLETALDRVIAAGGAIIVPIFAFPGGRRFHATDPAGNEIAVAQPD